MKWLRSAFPDALLEYVIEEVEHIERVTATWWGCPKRTADSVSIFCDSSGHEIRISFSVRSSNARVPDAVAVLMVFEGKRQLYEKKSTHKDHEELGFMLNFLGLFSLMYCFEENYFKDLRRLEKQSRRKVLC